MKYYTTGDWKLLKSKAGDLNSLDRAILRKCEEFGMNITRIIKAGKPYYNKSGSRKFATTDEVLSSVDKLQGMGLLKRR